MKIVSSFFFPLYISWKSRLASNRDEFIREFSQRDTTRGLIKKKGIEPLINLGFREKEIQRFTVTAIKLIERFWNGSNWSLLGRAKKINKAFHSINLIPPSPRNSTSIPTCLKKEKWNLCICKGKKKNIRIFMQ